MDKSKFVKFNMGAFVQELERLIDRSTQCAMLLIQNQELRARLEILEQDQKTLVATKAVEYGREVKTEFAVQLALQLAPLFGMTKSRNYEAVVRDFLSKKYSATSR